MDRDEAFLFVAHVKCINISGITGPLDEFC